MSDEELDLARSIHETAEERATGAESRAGKIGQLSLALLAITFTATGFEAARLRSLDAAGWVWWIALAPAGLSIVSFVIATTQAAGAEHRVRLAHPPSLEDVVLAAPEKRRRLLVEQHHRAALQADWSAKHRLDEVLQARAWLTRGMLGAVLVGVGVVALWGASPT
ncbi:MAG: hypothetical protein U0Q22_08460 [Acidimicrobiales bacterium]